jgi:MFS-type transporter involved in bile tolerance (Atg22 family)
MIEHIVFDNLYYRALLAFLLCVILAFSQDIRGLRKSWFIATLFILAIIMIFTNMYNDYGFMVLVIILLILSMNKYLKNKKNIPV